MQRPYTVYRRYLYSSTAVLLGIFALAAPSYGFNPDEDAHLPESSTKRLPNPALAITEPALLYAPGTVAPTATSGYISPLAPVAMPAKPLYPERADMVAAPVSAPLAAPAVVMQPAGMPPVDPAVAAHAQAIMAAENAAATPAPMAAPASVTQPLASPASGFVAPAPVFARTPSPAPVVTAAPVMAAAPELSDETRTILSHVPASMDAPKIQAGSIKMDRVDPEINDILGQKAQEDSYEAVGLSIKVRRPGLDTNYELSRAYTALMGGDTQTAIETYKNILGVDSRNEEALFGLAATYHRLGNIDAARPFYGMLLKVNPNHREGLNNFLVLASDESPQDALPELERLEARNPEFSPIPAQIAIVLDKMGYADASREKMLRAIELAPDNTTYKYNLAIMLDRRREYVNAAALYRNLIQASLQGANVPASTEAMQKRLNYIVTSMNSARTAMGQ